MVFSNRPLQLILVALVASLPLFSSANNSVDSVKAATVEKVEVAAHHGEATETKVLSKEEKAEADRKAFVKHHLLDSHDFTLFSYGKDEEHQKHFGFALPVILIDNGLQVFSSSKFEHGEAVAESNGNYYKINHHDGKVYKTDAEGTFSENEHGHVTNAQPIDLSITKNVLMIIVVGLIMFLLFAGLGKSYKKNGSIAKGAGRFFEPIIIYIRDEIAIPNIGEKHYKKYMSFLLTIFFFIWFLNMFGLTPLGVNITGNLAVTASLAILTYLITTFTAKKDYWKHIFWMPGVPVPMKFVLAPIELLGTIIKPFSLTIRLYANMLAGHVVLMTLIALMYKFNSPIGSPLSFMLAFVLSLLEVLVALLQAYIFTMLSALYFGSASEEHHHEEAHH
ncbi:F0F1 ATP synthase subunit A [Flavobacterium sp. SUN046]|uniref:F0F1 ATP synthase subunit A n=1 Tax=Flavobacterium sp. SUN046 TaxID=3002440 RepID=UPI002DBC274D|nr:F0F1 ATP synthase subunit A [Flavobacterium sp. SUN046]MEC4048231.1 F0F1 ATP synthase subunit A [Flavobacterium sp. SUN046]